MTPVPHVLLSVSLAGPAPSGSPGYVPALSGLLPPSPASPGSGCPQLQRPAATGRRRRSLTSTRITAPHGALSSACRCHEPRDRSVIASASGTSSVPACARPRQSSRGDPRALPGQAGHQGVHAPPGDVPLGEEHRDERVGEQALPDRLRRSRRRHRRRDPAAASPPVPAPAVRGHPDDDLPVQQLRDMIAAQRRERRPAFRAAVPAALKVPDHLNPGQVRVIPPPRPRPRPPRPALITARPAGRRLAAALILRRRRLRPRPLRRITEHHPLQDRQRSAHPLKLSRLPRDLGITPRESLPQLRGSLLPALVRLQRRSQRSPQRRHISIRTRNHPRHNRHAAQQTPSPAANHAPHASASPRTHPRRRETPSPDFRILTLVVLDNVRKRFGDLQVLHDINLTLRQGEVLVIIGPSGGGKSTLCRTINRLELIDSGTILFRRQTNSC